MVDRWIDGYWYPPDYSADLRYRHGSEEEAGDWQPKSIADAAQIALHRITYAFDVEPECDSPIEVILGAALLTIFDRNKKRLILCRNHEIGRYHNSMRLVPQFRWSMYRSDFAIILPNGLTLLIECDGKDFHSSPDQKIHDQTKDAAALRFGYPTVRFSGSEIHKGPDQCATKIFESVSPS
jgi:very-short-patch-repair endonuclease